VSHIDEGRLHAWLDGAFGPESGPEGAAADQHLATCNECRMRLEAARTVRDRARSVLASADHPPPAAPPFAEIVARAQAESTESEEAPGLDNVRAAADFTRRRIWPGTSRVGIAWAASITLAVGAGWLGRELALRRGMDLPYALDTRRESVQVLTEDESRSMERAQEEAVPALREGVPEDALASQVPEPGATQARQKAETKVVGAEAEEDLAAGQGKETRKLDTPERVDAELAEVTARPAAPVADDAVRQMKDEQIGSRARFAAPPTKSGSAAGHPALGCWLLEVGQAVPGAPLRIRLTDEPADRVDGALRLETDSNPLARANEPTGWMPLGADSVWLSIPPMVSRLSIGVGELEGLAMVEPPAAGAQPSRVKYGQVECSPP